MQNVDFRSFLFAVISMFLIVLLVLVAVRNKSKYKGTSARLGLIIVAMVLGWWTIAASLVITQYILQIFGLSLPQPLATLYNFISIYDRYIDVPR